MKRSLHNLKGLILLAVSVLILITLNACNDDEEGNSNAFLWSPKILVLKGDAQATLLLTDPRPFTEYVSPPTTPDYFEIFVSEDNISFSPLTKVGTDVTQVPVDKLTNGKSYYFFVTAARQGITSALTDTVMTIPSRAFATESYFPDVNESVETLTTSFDRNYISYNAGSDLYYRESGSASGQYVATNANGATWSKNSNQLAYITTTTSGISRYPHELRLLTTAGGQSTTLFSIDYPNFSLQYPEFTGNADELTFFSNENNPDKSYYDLWKMDVITLQRQRITSFQSKGFYTGGRYDWSHNAEEVYLAGRYNIQKYESDIYKVNISSAAITPIVVSPQWFESNPAISPDNNRIAFTSDGSGRGELWVYDVAKSRTVQVTPIEGYLFDERYTELQWLNDHEILITAFKNTKSVPVKITLD
ncbi:hypothetical protein WBG78_12495 [Chryseolinea sp. T2]|uniref:TolB family protein n=1 Tax=Chryseolinea sp. T2 TaxID=3129255 RepID=UPI003076FAFC